MPLIYEHVGIYMYFYFSDHNPPHIHIEAAEYKGTMNIKDFKTKGNMTQPMIKLAKEFVSKHQDELLKMWKTQKAYQIED